ncbi:helix-turn-helix domain-containing protein [Mycolicibacterium sp. XJ775]
MSLSQIRPTLGEVYMEIRDRKKLARLMIVQDETQRSLSAAAGWRSHSYLGRLLRGEVKTLDTEAALRIAHKLRVPVDDLFVIRVDSNPVDLGQKQKSPAA